MICRCLYIVLAFWSTSSCSEQNVDSHVTEVELGMLTHVVLLKSKAGYCSGSVVSEEYVLTSANCLVSIKSHHIFGRYRTFSMEPLPKDGVYLTAGIVDLMKTELQHRQERVSKEVIVHPYFRPMKLGGFDVGLVKVSPPFNFSDVIFRVEFPDKGWDESRKGLCQSSGFGDLSVPQNVKLKMWDVEAHHGESTCPCTKRFQWKRMICSKPDNQPVLCEGDRGAALICDDKVVAITHMVRSRRTCDFLNYPNCSSDTLNTYMFLCPYQHWIRQYVPKVPPTPESCLALRSSPTFTPMFIFAVLATFIFKCYL